MSIYPETDRNRWILKQRGPKNRVQEDLPYAFFQEQERTVSGQFAQVSTVFLTNKECPWRCLMCDLWKNTLDHEVSPGSIPTQIRHALKNLPAPFTKPSHLKLYNSGSFFDPHAIPIEDHPEIATIANRFEHLIVECHPALITDKVLLFKQLLRCSFEIAMGLETVHPQSLKSLNKGLDLDIFRRKCEFLKANGIFIRVFLLLQPPFVPPEEAAEWAMNGISFARECQADVVVLIPTRTGNGAMDLLTHAEEFKSPPLSLLEQTLQRSLSFQPAHARIFADTWDLDRFSSCPYCLALRKARLDQTNLTQTVPCPCKCDHCNSTF